MAFDWVPGATLGVAGAALAWWRSTAVSEAKFQERLEQIRTEMASHTKANESTDDQFKRELYAAINELRAVTLTIAKLTSGQDIINAVTTKTLDALSKKAEDHDRQLSYLGATIGLIRQWLERSEQK